MFMVNLKQINRKLLINFSDNTPNYCTFITFIGTLINFPGFFSLKFIYSVI